MQKSVVILFVCFYLLTLTVATPMTSFFKSASNKMMDDIDIVDFSPLGNRMEERQKEELKKIENLKKEYTILSERFDYLLLQTIVYGDYLKENEVKKIENSMYKTREMSVETQDDLVIKVEKLKQDMTTLLNLSINLVKSALKERQNAIALSIELDPKDGKSYYKLGDNRRIKTNLDEILAEALFFSDNSEKTYHDFAYLQLFSRSKEFAKSKVIQSEFALAVTNIEKTIEKTKTFRKSKYLQFLIKEYIQLDTIDKPFIINI